MISVKATYLFVEAVTSLQLHSALPPFHTKNLLKFIMQQKLIISLE